MQKKMQQKKMQQQKQRIRHPAHEGLVGSR